MCNTRPAALRLRLALLQGLARTHESLRGRVAPPGPFGGRRVELVEVLLADSGLRRRQLNVVLFGLLMCQLDQLRRRELRNAVGGPQPGEEVL